MHSVPIPLLASLPPRRRPTPFSHVVLADTCLPGNWYTCAAEWFTQPLSYVFISPARATVCKTWLRKGFKKGLKVVFSSLWETHHRTMKRRHLPCEITQCYLPPDKWTRFALTSVRHWQTGTRWISVTLSWPWWLVFYLDGLCTCRHPFK